MTIKYSTKIIPIPRKPYTGANNSGPNVTILIKKCDLASYVAIAMTLDPRADLASSAAKSTAENVADKGSAEVCKTPELRITDPTDFFLFPIVF